MRTPGPKHRTFMAFTYFILNLNWCYLDCNQITKIEYFAEKNNSKCLPQRKI